MENYIVSARKYRPSTFASVVGQSHVSNTLKSAILLGQLAHAFLFSGPRGVGKTTCARILAKAINCNNLTAEGEPCNSCNSCETFNQGKSINIHELDAASNNSVDDIRNLTDQTRYIPPNGRKSVYIIDEVHMLSQAAFNAFLKTLEEPPAHVLFILATTEKHKILPTILSRCQKFDFRRIRVEDIAKHLAYIADEEQIDYEYAALQQIGLKADGALRDALSLFDQLVSYSGRKLTFSSVLENLNILDYDYYFRAVEAIRDQDHSGLLLSLNEIIEKGFEAKDFLTGLTEHFRNLLICKSPDTIRLLETSENVKAQYDSQSKELDAGLLLNAFNVCSETEQNLRNSAAPRLLIELCLIKLAHLSEAIRISTGGVVQSDAGSEKKKQAEERKLVSSVPDTRKKESLPVKAEANDDFDEKLSSPPEKIETDQQIEKIEQQTSIIKEEPISNQPVARKQMKGTGLNIPQNLSAIEIHKTSDDKDGDNSAPIENTILENIQIDPDLFRKNLNSYAKVLKAKGQISKASVLETLRFELNHNQCILIVGDNLGQNLLQRETKLLAYLKRETSVSTLFIEYQLDPNIKKAEKSSPYTEEEKLEEMAKNNPAVAKLRTIFKTRIIYS